MNEYEPLLLPCGSVAEFDEGSGCSHRCWTCMATLGSVAMPDRCREEILKWEAYEKQKLWKWDYTKGKGVEISDKMLKRE